MFFELVLPYAEIKNSGKTLSLIPLFLSAIKDINVGEKAKTLENVVFSRVFNAAAYGKIRRESAFTYAIRKQN